MIKSVGTIHSVNQDVLVWDDKKVLFVENITFKNSVKFLDVVEL